jgi:hypothetical protein
MKMKVMLANVGAGGEWPQKLAETRIEIDEKATGEPKNSSARAPK